MKSMLQVVLKNWMNFILWTISLFETGISASTLSWTASALIALGWPLVLWNTSNITSKWPASLRLKISQNEVRNWKSSAESVPLAVGKFFTKASNALPETENKAEALLCKNADAICPPKASEAARIICSQLKWGGGGSVVWLWNESDRAGRALWIVLVRQPMSQ